MTALIRFNHKVHLILARALDRAALRLAVKERQGLVRASGVHSRRWPEAEELR